MKQGISIFTLLGTAVLAGCLILSTALLVMQYQNAQDQSQRERASAFALNRALMQAVINGHLDQLKQQTTQLAERLNSRLRTASSASMSALKAELARLSRNDELNFFDRILLDPAQSTSDCQDFSEPFFRTPCRPLIDHLDLNLEPWSLYRAGGERPQVGIFSREPLIRPTTGQVIGHLYAGTVFTDNFRLLNKVNSALQESPRAVAGLAYRGQLLATNGRLSPAQQSLVQQALSQPRETLVAEDSYAQVSPLWLDRKGSELQMITLLPAEPYQSLSERLLHQAVFAVVLGSLLALLISLAAIRLVLRPLVELIDSTRRTEADPNLPPRPALVREINQISQYLAHHMAQLRHSRQQLRRYSDELESAHEEAQTSNRASQARSRELESSNLKLRELTERNRSLLHQLFHLQEEERRHLAEELHDELGQNLAAVSTEAHLIRSLLPENSPAYQNAQNIYRCAKDMYDVVYNRIVSLRPLTLNDLGLGEAIRHMPVIRQLERQGCQVELALEALPVLRNEVAINLFRITQEALDNTLRHARAGHASIQLGVQDQMLRIHITDDGQGMTGDPPIQRAGLGISGMRERARAIQGQLDIETSPGGTSLETRVPLSAAIAHPDEPG